MIESGEHRNSETNCSVSVRNLLLIGSVAKYHFLFVERGVFCLTILVSCFSFVSIDLTRCLCSNNYNMSLHAGVLILIDSNLCSIEASRES